MAQAATPAEAPDTIHATCVAHQGRAVLITGASGSGKSALALQLIALGAHLIADDRTRLMRQEDLLLAACPPGIIGQIEARYFGILAMPTPDARRPVRVALVVDMDTVETDRLPPERHSDIAGVPLPLQRKVDAPHFPAAILAYLSGTRIA